MWVFYGCCSVDPCLAPCKHHSALIAVTSFNTGNGESFYFIFVIQNLFLDFLGSFPFHIHIRLFVKEICWDLTGISLMYKLI